MALKPDTWQRHYGNESRIRKPVETDNMSEAEFARFAERAARPRPMGYRAALRWIILNDDTEWLGDAEPMISTTAAFAADIFDRPQEKVIADLRRMKERL